MLKYLAILLLSLSGCTFLNSFTDNGVRTFRPGINRNEFIQECRRTPDYDVIDSNGYEMIVYCQFVTGYFKNGKLYYFTANRY